MSDSELTVHSNEGDPEHSQPEPREIRWGRFALVGAVLMLLASSGWMVGARNQMVGLDTEVDTQWSQVENQLLRQYELLPKLVAVAKRYAEHEKEVLANLADARSRYLEAPAIERPELAMQIDGALVNVLAVAENYPDLKADRQYRDLAFEIAGTKNRIAVERGRYNESVGVLNTKLRQVPWMFVAQSISPREFYEVDPAKTAEPQLDI